MATVSSNLGSQAVRYGWEQLKLQEARRNAEQAEQTARSLQQQAAAARGEADRAEETARSLSVQSSQAQGQAGRARQGLAMQQTASEMGRQLSQTLDQVGERIAQSSASESQVSQPQPVPNAQGQTTGQLIHVTA